MDSNSHDDKSVSQGRRELLQAIVAGSGWVATRALLPAVWSSPIVGSMLLPEHAAASYNTTTDTVTSEGVTFASAADDLAGTGPNAAAIVAIAGTGTVSLTIYPPSEVFAERVQYHVYEYADDDNEKTKGTVVALMTPSNDSALSARVDVSLKRNAGGYHYQLRLVDGRHTAWVGVKVQ